LLVAHVFSEKGIVDPVQHVQVDDYLFNFFDDAVNIGCVFRKDAFEQVGIVLQVLPRMHPYPAVNDTNGYRIFGVCHFYSEVSHHGMQNPGIHKSARAGIEGKTLMPEGAHQPTQFLLFFNQQGAFPSAGNVCRAR